MRSAYFGARRKVSLLASCFALYYANAHVLTATTFSLSTKISYVLGRTSVSLTYLQTQTGTANTAASESRLYPAL